MLERMQEQGQDPPALANRPTLEPHLKFVWETFWELNTERPPSMGGVTRIPYRAFLDYAYTYQFTRQDTKDIWPLVRQLDTAYITYHDERQAEKVAKDKQKAGRPGPRAKHKP